MMMVMMMIPSFSLTFKSSATLSFIMLLTLAESLPLVLMLACCKRRTSISTVANFALVMVIIMIMIMMMVMKIAVRVVMVIYYLKDLISLSCCNILISKPDIDDDGDDDGDDGDYYYYYQMYRSLIRCHQQQDWLHHHYHYY